MVRLSDGPLDGQQRCVRKVTQSLVVLVNNDGEIVPVNTPGARRVVYVRTGDGFTVERIDTL